MTSPFAIWIGERTQREIAKAMEADGFDITSATVGAWVRGEAFPSADKWPALAKVFGVKVEQISKAAIDFHSSKAA